MLHRRFDNASAQYRSLAMQSEIERADPHRLVALMYEELTLCVDVLIVCAHGGQRLADKPQAHKARSIVLALRSGLDFNAAGDLAATLDGLYAALADELDQRLADGDPDRLAELRASVVTLSEAWASISGAPR